MPNARIMYPVTASERDSLYRCKICGAITRYDDRLKHSIFHDQVKALTAAVSNQPQLIDDPPPY